MAVIHELSPHLADLIAAGEVVERPSSVAKELVENAIDAGSTRITVEIENGGITYLRIADNGCGMSAEDAPVAFRRHAASKLRTEEDLNAIGTLGFRGEALAAISSVTRIDLFTRQAGSIAGLHLHLEAGEIQTQEEAGCPEGTTIVVRDLFFNTPARMKFLKGLHRGGLHSRRSTACGALPSGDCVHAHSRRQAGILVGRQGQADCTGVRCIRQGNDCQYD